MPCGGNQPFRCRVRASRLVAPVTRRMALPFTSRGLPHLAAPHPQVRPPACGRCGVGCGACGAHLRSAGHAAAAPDASGGEERGAPEHRCSAAVRHRGRKAGRGPKAGAAAQRYAGDYVAMMITGTVCVLVRRTSTPAGASATRSHPGSGQPGCGVGRASHHAGRWVPVAPRARNRGPAGGRSS